MKFKVISIHFTTECNLKCPFCYKQRCNAKQEKPRDFWLKLVPYLPKLTGQIALGGGEPFTDRKFIKAFGKECKKNKLIFNVTSNGRLLMNLKDAELKDVCKDITMISLSFDDFKIRTAKDFQNYTCLVRRIKNLTQTQVGCNLLINDEMFNNSKGKGKIKGLNFALIVRQLFNCGIDRVFALYPKKNKYLPNFIPILKYKKIYEYLTLKYPKFYCDDLTKQILENGKYQNWDKPCHYAKDIISINEKGEICGCSFDNEKQALLKLKKPKDILKISKVKAKERFSCPYL